MIWNIERFWNCLFVLATLGVAVLTAGCGGDVAAVDEWEQDGLLLATDVGQPLSIDHRTALGVVSLVNDPKTDEVFLDEEAHLDARAAERIVGHRRGPDGIDGTFDDDLFDGLFELDGVAYVGPATIEQLAYVAHQFDRVPVVEVEGVLFTETERGDTLALANLGSIEALDFAAGLDVRAAEALVAGRPYLALSEVAERPYVGPAALESLKDFAPEWVDEALETDGNEAPVDPAA